MSYILYGGIKYKQIRHAVFCKKCKETVESKSVHDYRLCSCGAVGVDGGTYPGNTVLGNLSDMESRSVYAAKMNGKTVWLPPEVYGP